MGMAAPASAALTDAEAGSLMKSSVAYIGKYDVDPAQTPDRVKVTIHVDAAASEASAPEALRRGIGAMPPSRASIR
jgi:hypothetical protein